MYLRHTLPKGIAMVLLAALLTCLGQLFWKLAMEQDGLLLLLPGFACYGCGALLMILAMRYGELSVLHPMMSAGYVLSVGLGLVVLHEAVTPQKLLGIAVIIAGLIFLSLPERGDKR